MSVNWNKHTCREVTYHSKTCTDVRWNCDGSYLGSASYDKTVKIGQLSPDGGVKTVQTVQCAQLIQSVSWHPSEPQRFVIAGDDKSIELWDVRASRASAKMASLGNNINVVWSPDGRYLAVGNSQDKLAVIDVHASKIVKKANFGYEVNELAWTANSDHMLVANAFGEMGNVDVISFHNEELTLIDTITAHTSNSYCLKVDARFQRMAVGSADHLVSLWDLDDLVCHHNFTLDSPVRALSFNGEGTFIAAACESSIVQVSDSSTGECVAKVDTKAPIGGAMNLALYESVHAGVNVLSWHPKLNIIAVGTEGGAFPHQHGYAPPPTPAFIKLLTFSSIT